MKGLITFIITAPGNGCGSNQMSAKRATLTLEGRELLSARAHWFWTVGGTALMTITRHWHWHVMVASLSPLATPSGLMGVAPAARRG